ncbi:GH25 family lysozyme [Nocardia sp. CA-128927]|uniref:GH25 family lysozyme n=1 Tax=Nocardia sp. CA-128927 TaxID=3239975 RepID=UPI003D983532
MLPSSTARAASAVEGIDVAGSTVDWVGVKAKGVVFAYIKATEGRSASSAFGRLNSGVTSTDLFHGAYHVPVADAGSAVDQANYFVDHGGAWTAEGGHTLPGAVLLQDKKCFGISPEAMVRWLKDFSNTYRTRSQRPPVIATTTEWWQDCTGNSADFGSVNPLWTLHSGSSADPVHTDWTDTFTQYAVSGANRGADRFNGDQAALERFAGQWM